MPTIKVLSSERSADEVHLHCLNKIYTRQVVLAQRAYWVVVVCVRRRQMVSICLNLMCLAKAKKKLFQNYVEKRKLKTKIKATTLTGITFIFMHMI